jgi:hypothetical protein
MAPIIGRLEDEYSSRVDFRIVDAAGGAAEKLKYKYVSQPQFVLVNKQREIVSSILGYQGYNSLRESLDKLLATR